MGTAHRIPPLRRIPREWHDDRNNVVVLLRDLQFRGEITTADDAIAVVEKPQKWTPEWNRMVAMLRGALGDDTDEAEVSA